VKENRKYNGQKKTDKKKQKTKQKKATKQKQNKTKQKQNKQRTMVYKNLHRKTKIGQHETPLKRG
jgi:hypothetical protein